MLRDFLLLSEREKLRHGHDVTRIQLQRQHRPPLRQRLRLWRGQKPQLQLQDHLQVQAGGFPRGTLLRWLATYFSFAFSPFREAAPTITNNTVSKKNLLFYTHKSSLKSLVWIISWLYSDVLFQVYMTRLTTTEMFGSFLYQVVIEIRFFFGLSGCRTKAQYIESQKWLYSDRQLL